MKKVIFIDDEKVLHSLIKFEFKEEIEANKISLEFFLNGQECLDYLRQDNNSSNIDFVFSDISMPIMDGLTLAKHLKEEFSDLPLYMVSALEFEEYKNRAESANALGFMGKPIDFDRVREIIFKK